MTSTTDVTHIRTLVPRAAMPQWPSPKLHLQETSDGPIVFLLLCGQSARLTDVASGEDRGVPGPRRSEGGSPSHLPHRRPDRVVAVNTTLKTEYGGAIVGHGGSCQEEPSQYSTARCGAGVPVWGSKERPTDRLGISGLPTPTSLPVVADRGPSKRGHSKCVVRRGYSVWVGGHQQ
ncbi:hypothetical protein ACOMHN_060536 [Nucella lapillus]